MKLLSVILFLSFIKFVTCGLCNTGLECVECIKSKRSYHIMKNGPLCADKRPDIGVLIEISIISRCGRLCLTTLTTQSPPPPPPQLKGFSQSGEKKEIHDQFPQKSITSESSRSTTQKEWEGAGYRNDMGTVLDSRPPGNEWKHESPANEPEISTKTTLIPTIIPEDYDAIPTSTQIPTPIVMEVDENVHSSPVSSSAPPEPNELTNKQPKLSRMNEKVKARRNLYSAICGLGNRINEFKRLNRGKEANDDELVAERERKCMRFLEL